MTTNWQRQAVGLAAGACLLTGVSAAQAAPSPSGLIDLAGLTITNGQSQAVDFDGDGHDDFTFSINAGHISFAGSSVFGFFSSGEQSGFGQGHNTLAVNSGGNAIGVGPGRTVVGHQSVSFGEGADAAFDLFDVTPPVVTPPGGTFTGADNGTIDDPIGPDEVIVGQFYQPADEPTVTVAEPMFYLNIDVGTDPNGDPTLTLLDGAFQRGDTIRTPSNVPEPGVAMLLLGGLMGLGAYRRRKQA
jgi:hypothetical protein